MNNDPGELIRQFDFEFPSSVVGELMARQLALHCQLFALKAFFAQIAASALGNDEEYWVGRLKELQDEKETELLADLISRFGRLPNVSE